MTEMYPDLIEGLTAAGIFAAFISVAIAFVLAHDYHLHKNKIDAYIAVAAILLAVFSIFFKAIAGALISLAGIGVIGFILIKLLMLLVEPFFVTFSEMYWKIIDTAARIRQKNPEDIPEDIDI